MSTDGSRVDERNKPIEERWEKTHIRHTGIGCALRITRVYPEGTTYQDFEMPEWIVDQIIDDHRVALLVSEGQV